MEKRIVQFSINGKEYQVSENEGLTPESYLVDYIRDKAGLKGTKHMCREGGCGSCVVTATIKKSLIENSVPKAVNSCLAPVFSCDGWDISTVEFLGNKYQGYHPIQDRMVKFGGSQCGFCTPGMVMSMYSLLESKSEVRVQDVENALDGNICRCTGYRPILDAFKSLTVDAPRHIRQWCSDIEDCVSCPMKHVAKCSGINTNYVQENIRMEISGGQKWIKLCDLNAAFRELNSFRVSNESYRIVAGNTGHGAFPTSPVKYYLDISCIPELSKYTANPTGQSELTLGSGVTLKTAIEVLLSISERNGDFRYTEQISKHLQKITSVPVRNRKTLGGDLMLKYLHREYQSDVFVLLESVGAKITIASSPKNLSVHSLVDFLFNVNMDGKIIISLHLPRLDENTYRFNSFKISRRYENSHAYVNAGILFRIDQKNNFLVLKKSRIVYGGISPAFVHADNTEKYLIGKRLQDQETLTGAMQILDDEVFPNQDPNEPSPFYRKLLAKSLLYKAILKILGGSKNPRVNSGAEEIVHKSSSGKQTYDENTDKVALYKAIPKREAIYEVSGEAEYVDDIPALPNELFGAFVLSTIGNARLKSVDTSEALKIPGVCRFIDTRDIPGQNNYFVFGVIPPIRPESVFLTSDRVEYAGQAIGLLLAESDEIARFAVTKVKVSYKNVQKPIVRTADALDKVEREGTLDKHTLGTFISQKKSNKIPTHTVKGKWYNGAQYHLHMETQQCVCHPKEDSMEVYSSTQWMDQIQSMIAYALNKPTNYVKVKVRRLGGGFGAKETRAALAAIPCAVAAYLTNRPVRVITDMPTNMSLVGKRSPYLSRYKVSFDDNGAIAKLKTDIFTDAGFSENEADTVFGAGCFQSVYKADGWEVRAGFVTTNTPANTWCRCSATLNCVALIEYIMEHIAFELKKDPLEVRLANLWEKGDLDFVKGTPFEVDNSVPKMLSDIKKSSDYEQRKRAVKKFNDENRWKKRGLSVSPATYFVDFLGSVYPVYIAIYHFDGSVAVTHGGIEMGQGINIKVAQTVSTFLQCPLEKILIYPSESLTGNNAFVTAGSIASELCCDGAIRACKILTERMKPIKDKLGDVSWEELVVATFDAKIDLSASYMHTPNDNVKEYLTWTLGITEVEVDMLTGEYKVVRVDVLEDVGKSLNPLVDIGQIEGAFIMGQGFWTSEKIIHDENSGVLLTNRCWNYKPPGSKDIPEDFRVTILRNSPNPFGVLRSKAIGEPPMTASVSVFFALKSAINSAREDAGNSESYQLDGPVTPEDVLTYSLTSSRDFIL